MTGPDAILISKLSHRYGKRTAVDDLSLTVAPGELFGILGPNGSGKTTLFRVLATLIPLQAGQVEIFGLDLVKSCQAIRQQLGVVFQAPSIDKKLTVAENLRHHGRLYGLSGTMLRTRSAEMLAAFGLSDRAGDLAESLSGGMRRRVELAKGMLSNPRMLLLDEPSTGLDPGARRDLWQVLDQLKTEQGVTILITTHLLEEADRADRLAIMHEGRLAALDTPAVLRESIGGDLISMQSEHPARLATRIREQFHCDALVVGGEVRIEQSEGHLWIPRLAEAFGDEIQTITLGKPSLADVFVARTGHRFFGEVTEKAEAV